MGALMSLLNKTDDALVEEFFCGSENSFIELVSRYETKVFNTALYLTNDSKDAEEVLQQVFLSLHQKLNEDRGSISLFKWLVQETLNTAVSKLVEQREEDTQVERLTNDIKVLTRSFEKRNADARNLFQVAVSGLPHDVRAVFLLLDVLGLEKEKVQGILMTTELEMRSKLMRARREVRRVLSEVVKDIPAEVANQSDGSKEKVVYLRA